MKILKFNKQYIHPIAFSFLSMPFLISYNSIKNGKSLFYNLNMSLEQVTSAAPMLILLAFLILIQIRLVKMSKVLSLATYFFIFATMIYSTFQVNNKLLIILSFLYLFFSFYFFTIWDLFLTSAALNPMFHGADIEKESIFKIKGRFIDKKSGEIKVVYLTNLDKNSGYIYFSEKTDKFLGDNFDLELDYENVTFKSNCTPIASQYNGLGFNYNSDWLSRSISSLYKICLDRQIF